MDNVGVVIYKIGTEPGTLNVEFCHTADGKGNGFAIGGPTQGFEGNYNIQYFDEKGNLQAERELEIKKDGIQYNLRWFLNEKLRCKGIGFETSEGLIVGYYDL